MSLRDDILSLVGTIAIEAPKYIEAGADVVDLVSKARAALKNLADRSGAAPSDAEFTDLDARLSALEGELQREAAGRSG